MLRQIVKDRRFAFVDLILVIISGVIGIIKPESGFWFLLIALLPWMIRLVAGESAFPRTAFDLLVAVFLFTAAVGYFIGYDKVAAYEKLYFIVTAILLYYALSGQPTENGMAISAVLFLVGVCIALYFFLTHDFIRNPREIEAINRIGVLWMGMRPQLKWTPIPSGYIPGLAFISTPFIMSHLFNPHKPSGLYLKFSLVLGFVIVSSAILATTSLSVWFAFFSAIGVWVVWKALKHYVINQPAQKYFPWLVLTYLLVVILVLYTIGPATSSSPNFFGSNSRLEVFSRSIHFLLDYPIIGAGLASFPGLYSQYILGIPYYYFSNSYNLFLDVAIEQGLAGGIALLTIYLMSIFRVARKVQNNGSNIQAWLALFVLMFAAVHGLMQDYLYYSAGTIFLFLPIGMSVFLTRDSAQGKLPKRTTPDILFTKKQKSLSVLLGITLLVGVILNRNKLASIWYANLGAVQLAQVELAGFPETGWLGLGIIPQLQNADASLQTSLQLDPANQTANYRLGLIHILRRDYMNAAKYLESAHSTAPHHRGIIKSLGYCYLWMGEDDKARALLAQIPEAAGELDAYYWWWKNQGREDLSKHAYSMIKQLNSTTDQP